MTTESCFQQPNCSFTLRNARLNFSFLETQQNAVWCEILTRYSKNSLLPFLAELILIHLLYASKMIMRPEKVTGEHLDPCLVQMDYLYHLSASSPWKHIDALFTSECLSLRGLEEIVDNRQESRPVVFRW